MSFFVQSAGDFELCPAGVHLARCYRIVDLGTQKTEYNGETKFQHKLQLGWEIHGTDDRGNPIKMSDGRPFAVYKQYTLSWSEKANLRQDLQSWRGRPFSQEEMRRFDLKNVLGAWCMLNLLEKRGNDGKVYTNVDAITPVPGVVKQAGLPVAHNKDELFSFQNPDLALLETFSNNLKNRIKSSPEYLKLDPNQYPSREPGSDDDLGEEEAVPF